MNVDTAPRTLLVATCIALLCSAMVSLAVYYLRPMQVGLQSQERNRAILAAAELLPAEVLTDKEVARRFLELDARIVDLRTSWFATGIDARTYDHWQIREGTGPDNTESDQVDRYVPVYLVRKADDEARIILPVDGRGMWSTIYGYVALGADLNTITGVTFHRHGETPAIGDQIQDPAWLASWHGKRIRDENETLRFHVTKDASGPYEVDSITGATITSDAAGESARTWLDEEHFGPFLERLDESEPQD